jgi:hypothetical protein
MTVNAPAECRVAKIIHERHLGGYLHDIKEGAVSGRVAALSAGTDDPIPLIG